MAPAAPEVSSPISSQQKSCSSNLQNPSSVPLMFSSADSNVGAFRSGFGGPIESGVDSSAFQRSGSAAPSVRSRPRLLKVRRQAGSQHPKSRAGSSEVGLGFNPFSSVSSGTGVLNGVSFSNADNGHVGFVFGANQSSNENGKSNVCSETESMEFENLGFVSGANQSSNENGKSNVCSETESVKFENLGFVFGSRENDMESKLCGDKRESVANRREVVFDDKGNDKIEPKLECMNLSGMGFVFGCNLSGFGLNSNWEKRERGDSDGISRSDSSDKMKSKIEAESVKHVDFVFGANGSGFSSNLNLDKEKKGFDENFGQSNCYGGSHTKISLENEARKCSNHDFVIGASRFNSEPNLSSINRDSCENFGKPVSDDMAKIKVEHETECEEVKASINGSFTFGKDHASDSFVFGSSSSTSASLNESTQSFRMKSNGESLGSHNSNLETQFHNLESNDSVTNKFVSGRSNDVAGGSSSRHKLPDEMSKLNIDDSVHADGAEKNENSNKKSFLNAGTASMPIRYKKFSRFSARKSETASGKSSRSFSIDFEKTNKESSGSGNRSSASGSNAAGTSYISSTEPFTFNAGLCESTSTNAAFSPSPSSSTCRKFEPTVSEAASFGINLNNNKSSTQDGLGISFMDFKTLLCDPSCLKENLFPECNRNSEFVKNRSMKDKRFRETKRKVKKTLHRKKLSQDHASKEISSQENQNSSGCYSPMDFSPYQESTVADQYSSKNTTSSDQSSQRDASCTAYASDASGPGPSELKDQKFSSAGIELDSDKGDQKCDKINENPQHYTERIFIPSVPVAAFSSCSAQMEQVSGCSGGVSSSEFRADIGAETEKQNIFNLQAPLNSGLEDNEKRFMFSATSAGEENLSTTKRRYRRRSRTKVGDGTFVIKPSPNLNFESSYGQSSKPSYTSSLSDANATNKSEAGERFKRGDTSSSADIHITCEKWRVRGNQAYKDGNLSKAEGFYTQGIIYVPSSERTGSCLEPLLLCYSNRAAARMSLGRIRDAIEDCMMAAALDSSFLKAQLRAANCHLVLGEIDNALQYFNKCLESGAGVCLDRKIILDAADGQQKAQKVAECTDQSAKLLEQNNPDTVLRALKTISEALSISLYSEKLLKMKAEALIMLRRHEEAIQLCEQSLHFAEKNFISANALEDTDGSESQSFVRLWRWYMISKSYFYLGRFEAALPLLDKLTQVGSIKDEHGGKNLESPASLAVTIHELLQHKNAGNEAFKSKKYSEAVDHYTFALSCNVESRRFAAVCFCNRAAAFQALGQMADAIADCSLAISLDENYAKAVSRRATLHEMIRDYGQAASDLQKLVSVLENQSCDKEKESGSSGRSTGNIKDLRQAKLHLTVMEEEAKNGVSLDFYLILGSKPSDTNADIKKAYRKAALKHHPDKAGQFLARSDSGDEGRLWKEIYQEVHKDADRLFKMIGEAYAVLSDPTKREQYDLEEEVRKASKVRNASSARARRHSDACSSGGSSTYRSHGFQSSPFESSYRQYRDSWKTYGDSYSRW
ncbi:hypothetical protein UlMin_006094 [Ulmus minor]